jgi:hypothetical protein
MRRHALIFATFVTASLLFYPLCFLLIAIFYGWGGSAELAIPTTILTVISWAALLPFQRNSSKVTSGIWAAALTFLAVGFYAWLINVELGPDHPVLSIFGYATRAMFADDNGIVYLMFVTPLIAIASGCVNSLPRYVVCRLIRATNQ